MKRHLNVLLILLLILNIFSPVIVSADNSGEKEDKELLDDEIEGERQVAQDKVALTAIEGYEHLRNNDFSEHEDAGSTFSHMWEKEIKPKYWDLRNWASSGGNVPQAQVIEESESSIVKVDLDRTVGFYQYYESIPVIPEQSYDFLAKVKTRDISTPHHSQNAAFLRVEEWSGDAVLARRDLAFIKSHEGESEWMDLSGSLTTSSETTHVRVVLVFGGAVSVGNGSTGTIYIDSISMQSEQIEIEEIEILSESILASKGEVIALDYEIYPNNATAREVEWFSDDDNIATVSNEGIIETVNAGKTTITVQSAHDPSIQTSIEIEVIDGDLPITNIQFEQEKMSLLEGKGAILVPTISPANASNQEIIWKTSDQNIVTVTEGVVKSIDVGTATVIATTVDGNHSASVEITVESYETDEFDQMRNKWADNVVPNKHIDLNNQQIKQAVQKLSDDAREIWDGMNTNNVREYLWENAASSTNSADVTTNYRNLHTLTKAYATIGTEQYQNPMLLKNIISGLDWMDEHRYNTKGVDYNNWWDWQIGSPQFLNDIVAVLFDYLTEEQVTNYMEAVKTYVPRPTHYYGAGTATWVNVATGANLVDLTKVVAVQGINSKEPERIEAGRDHFPIMEVKTSGTGNGVYVDGSFVDHTNIAYTGTYGVVLLGSMVDMIYLLEGSKYSLNEDDLNNIYDMILVAFQPVIYRGLMLDMVNGRAISRENQDIGHGRGAIERIIQYTEFAPEEYKTQFESMVKHWITTSHIQNMPEKFSRIPVISMANQIMNDPSITPRGELIKHFNFANMDRVVHKRPGYLFGLSMYSDRIGAYEGNMNGENLKAHYTGSGMTYLYNNDLNQYNDDFWATVDFYRLPGITVDAEKELAPGVGTGRTSPRSWVGGSVIADHYGINGMYLDQSIFGLSLTGKKSWFMFDDEIVALGSDIQSNDGRNIETIVENRKIKDDGSNDLYVNGNLMSSELNWNEHIESSQWAHLSGNLTDSDIGYYFPTGENLTITKKARTGAWKDINVNGSEEKVTKNYVTMQIEHGKNPENEEYAYVLLPNKSKDETALYAENPGIQIIANTDKVQAVKENNLNILGANFWKNEEVTVDKITSHHQASIMVKEDSDDVLEIVVSDPTHQNNGVIEVDLNYEISSPLWMDARVQIVESNADTTKLTFDVAGAMGESIVAKFNLDENASGWEDHVIYQNDFEAGEEGQTISDWEKVGSGEAFYQKHFEPLYPQRDFTGIRKFDPVTGQVVIEYDFIPLRDDIDVVMAQAGQEQVLTDYPDFPIIVRASIVNSEGVFDARDGNQFKADNALAWEKDKTYHIRLEVDLDNETYNAYVTPKDGEQVQIATDYKFRDTAETPKNIGQFIMQDNKTDKGSIAFNYQVNGQSKEKFNEVMEAGSKLNESYYVQKSFAPQNSRTFINWSFMKETIQEDAFIFLGGEEEGIRLEIEGNQLIDRLNNQIIISSIKPETWYDLSLDINTATGKYQIFVDDHLIQSDLAWHGSEYIDTFRIDMDQKSESTIYIDDVLIRSMSVLMEEITIESEQTSLSVGETMQMQAKVKPSNAFVGGVRWSSSNEAVLSVSSDGLISAISEGIADITVVDRVTGLSAKKTITVRPAEKAILEEVTISVSNTSITPDGTVQLSLKGILSDGSTADLSTANITYQSSHPEFISITELGEVSVQEVTENIDSIKVWVIVDLDGHPVQSNNISLIMNHLENEIDKTSLLSKITEAKTISNDEGVYTEGSFAALQSAIAKAESALETIETESELSEALEALQLAIDGLVEFKEEQEPEPEPEPEPEKLDVSAFEKLVTEALSISNKDNIYTSDSFAALQSAIAKAESALETIETESELSEALQALQLGIDGLEKYVEIPIIEEQDPEGPKESLNQVQEGPKDGEKLSKTNTLIYNYLLFGFILLVVGGISAYKYRKKIFS